MRLLFGVLAWQAPLLVAQEKEVSQPAQVQIVYESFNLSQSHAAQSQREALTDVELYANLVKGLQEGKVTQDKLLVIRSIVGQEAKVDHVSELIFPSAYDPPELPNQIGNIHTPSYQENTAKDPPPLVQDPDQARRGDGWQEGTFPATPASAATPETLKLGDSLEVEAALLRERGIIELLFTATHTAPAGFDEWGQQLSQVKMPRFAEQKLQSKLALKPGQPALVGTITPEPSEENGEGKEASVRLAFVTAKIIETE